MIDYTSVYDMPVEWNFVNVPIDEPCDPPRRLCCEGCALRAKDSDKQ